MRAIVFDLDGTLLHYTREYEAVLAETFERVAGEAREEWLDAYDRVFYDRFRAHEPDPVREAFATALDGHPESDDVAVDDLVRELRERETAMCRPPDGARADLARLAEEHALAVLTNGVPGWQAHKLRANGLAEHFDCIVASYEVGTHKPDAAPFRAVEERLSADDYAMVGDDEAADVEGARDAGWAAHRYEGDGFAELPDVIDWE